MKVILFIVLVWPGDYGKIFTRLPMPDMEQCLKVLEATELNIPEGNAENEWAGFKTCYYKEE
jgi:hypothetical protein